MFTCSNLPVWLRKKAVWLSLAAVFLLCLTTWLIFSCRLGPFWLRSWLTVGFLNSHIGKIAAIIMDFLVVFFLWIVDRVVASPNEKNRKTPGDPPGRDSVQKVLHLVFAFLMVLIAFRAIYNIIMLGQFVHFWFNGDKEWWEANKDLFLK